MILHFILIDAVERNRPSWVAPEIFRGEHYTEKIDVYSYSIVLWELFCFKKPHQDQ